MTIDKNNKIEILEDEIISLIKSLKEVTNYYELTRYPVLYALFCDVLNRAVDYLPDNTIFFKVIINTKHTPGTAIGSLAQVIQMIEREKKFKLDIQERKLFLGAEDKIKMAEKSFDIKDYPSTFGNLNTALELILKDLLELPLTYKNMRISNIIDILIKNQCGPIEHLKELQKHVLFINNKVKHESFNPSKIESIDAIRVMQDFLIILNKKKMEIPKDVREKIVNME